MAVIKPALLATILFTALPGNRAEAQCTTPPDQNFGTHVDDSYAPSLTYECVTYTGGSNVGVAIGGSTIIAVESPAFSGSAVLINSNDASPGTYAEIGTANGYEFKLVSMTAEFFGHSAGEMSEVYNIVGYRDNVEVVRANGLNVTTSGTAGNNGNTVTWSRLNYNVDGSNSGNLSFGANWNNIDKVRFVVADAAPNTFLFLASDNIDFGPAEVLPVHFGPLHAAVTDDNLNIEWSTLSETNNAYFEVQVSDDGKKFTTLSKIMSKAFNGTSSSPIQYSLSVNIAEKAAVLGFTGLSLLFLILPARRKRTAALIAVCFLTAVLYSCYKNDTNPIDLSGNKIYLRIAQVDTDGTKSYSKIIIVNARNH
ncbi:hypothetical protein GCM10027516_34310 [Niabella aquatica]